MKKLIYLVFFINLLIILYFWWSGSADLLNGQLETIFLAFSRLSGLLAVYFVLLQFVMRGRAVWVEKTFGLNNLATAHRLNGYLSLSFIVLHFLLILTSYSLISETNSADQLVIFLTSYDDLLSSFIAVLLFILIVLFSIYIVRRELKYEAWYYIHLLTYLAVVLAWGHQLKLGGDFTDNNVFVLYWYILYIFVFGNLFVFRFYRQGYLFFKYHFKVADIVKETDDTTSIYISGRNLSKFKIQPGQFFIIRFLDSKRWMEAHPFSLSFVPKNNVLRLTIKIVGDFTSEIPKLKKGTPVLLDGPLGTFTSTSVVKNKFLFIAGGVGITPIRALIEELAVLKKDMILLYSSKTKNIIFKDEIDNLSKKYSFPVKYIITEDRSYKGEKGRIDEEKIKRLAPDFLKRDIYLCGPPAMMDTLIKLLHELGVSHNQIHYERFSL